MRTERRVTALLIAVTSTVVLLVPGVADAKSLPRASAPGAFGVVTSVAGSSAATPCGTAGTTGSFTLVAWKHTTVTVNVDATATTFTDRSGATLSFANVCVGDLVGAIGPVSGKTVAATQVFIAPPLPQGAFGTVAAVGSDTTQGACGTAGMSGSFTLTTWKKTTVTVDVDATGTTFTERGVTGATFLNVCVGDLVGAFGTASNGTISATKVFIAPPRPQGAFGVVTAVGSDTTQGACGAADMPGSFTLTTWKHATVTVDVDATGTTFVDPAVPKATFANVCVGELVGAVGTLSGSTVTATKVYIAPPPHQTALGAFGTVASVGTATNQGACGASDASGSFTLTTWKQTTVTVNVDATATTFVDPGVTKASFGNVCVGELVGAVGTVSGNTVTATKVFIAPAFLDAHGGYGR